MLQAFFAIGRAQATSDPPGVLTPRLDAVYIDHVGKDSRIYRPALEGAIVPASS